jgi:crossover junction endodeoxyribonuclease RuvC
MNAVGLDLSLTSTGYARADGTTGMIASKQTGPARLIEIRTAVLEVARGAHLAIIEGYSFGAKTNREVLGELGGVIRVALYGNRIRYVVAAPAQLKKFATGHHQASKEEVLVAATKQLAYDGFSNDEADALWLRQLGLAAYGGASVPPTQYREQVLGAIKWPMLGELGT